MQLHASNGIRRQKKRSLGFTVVDLTAHLFVVGLVIVTVPIFWQSSAASPSNTYRARAVLPVQLWGVKSR